MQAATASSARRPGYTAMVPEAGGAEEQELCSPPPRGSLTQRGKVATLLGVALAASCAALAWRRWVAGGHHRGLRSSLIEEPLGEQETKARQMLVAREGDAGLPCPFDRDTEYWDRNLDTRRGVKTAEACREACQQEAGCGAWTWGQDSSGATVCWLKVLGEGGVPYRHQMPGVVSGLPCRRSTSSTTSAPPSATTSAPARNLSTSASSTSAPARNASTSAPARSTTSTTLEAAAGHNRSSTSTTTELPAHPLKEKRTQRKVKVEIEAKDQDTKEEKEKLKNGSQAEPAANATAVASYTNPLLALRRDCHEFEDDMDYWNKNLYAEPKVASAKICQMRCQWEPLCGAWTWGKVRRTEGLTDVCFLKTLGETAPPTRHPKKGVVSGLPCAEQVQESTSLFCWALMQPKGYEIGLLREQYRRKVSMFACERYVIYSNSSIAVDKGLNTSVVKVDLDSKIGGEFMTALNTDVFLAVWKQVIREGEFQKSSWTLKVDPDCVFFPERLALTLRRYPEMDKGVYINNCKYGLHGPLEIFSRNAVRTWAKGAANCVRHFQHKCNGPCAWGEDLFIDQCLWKVLHVQRVDNWRILQEDHCDPPKGWETCDDASFTAFHPFKDSQKYWGCYANASKASKDKAAKADALISFK